MLLLFGSFFKQKKNICSFLDYLDFKIHVNIKEVGMLDLTLG